jgi:hypothetical protein
MARKISRGLLSAESEKGLVLMHYLANQWSVQMRKTPKLVLPWQNIQNNSDDHNFAWLKKSPAMARVD